ncbi:MAG: diguanylate cyclase [Halomonas sp.]|uniref:sensor domain-containing diguanylate cyclase n=1 Tax=Halomonas sp. TaxID=1486246 RepID=UPI001A0E69D9|nr:GGDEF domain-containing protein [Halomonas sp.]MBE0490482.1 diguanylate cyclase [Halomonas sp.]
MISCERSASPPLGLPPLPETLRSRLGECDSLPSLPAAAARVLMLARHPDTSLVEYAEAIDKDPALTLRLLSMANSSYYSRGGVEVCTSREAVSRLGLDTTLATVMSFALTRINISALGLDHLWQRAIIAALAARHLAARLCPQQAGVLFTVSLLQDIGVLAAIALDEQDYRQLIVSSQGHDSLVAAEHALYGCDHASIGAWLADSWGLPDHLAMGIASSHGDLHGTSPEALCLRLSGPIADAWLSATPARALFRLLHRFEALGNALPISLASLLEEVQENLPDMAKLLDITAPPIYDNHSLLEEAQQHLFRQALALSARMDTQEAELEALRQRQTELEQRSRRDDLTGLANRAWLEEQLKERFRLCREQGRTLSVVFIDLDHFKKLNDSYGHVLGDRVLENFAEALQESVREGDLAGRYGGEEFLVILPDERVEGAMVVANRLSQLLTMRPMAHADGVPLHVSVSIGIACLDDADFRSARELIDAADQSMYRVKREGRDGTATFSGAP